jgi:uncharacterized protein (DUF924 family)
MADAVDGRSTTYIAPMTTTGSDIVDFWRSAGSKAWYAKNDAFDASIRERFEADHLAAARGEHDDWAETAEGALALVLLFDQLPRNMWRRSAHAYATDPLGRQAAARAIDAGHDRECAPDLRAFFYLPFRHSEDLADQDISVKLSDALQEVGGPDAKWSRIHRDIIVRFGRFPHRNRCLGRETTPEEAAFLDAGGFAG